MAWCTTALAISVRFVRTGNIDIPDPTIFKGKLLKILLTRKSTKSCAGTSVCITWIKIAMIQRFARCSLNESRALASNDGVE